MRQGRLRPAYGLAEATPLDGEWENPVSARPFRKRGRGAQWRLGNRGRGVDASRPNLERLLMLYNYTYMFREAHALRRSIALSNLVHSARNGHRVRLWSAGCSTGEEAFTLAILLLELCPEAASLDLHILGTDVDPANIKAARTGLSERPELMDMIEFGKSDLRGHWRHDGPLDLIMCCSVAYHLDQPSRARLWSRLADALAPHGHLFVGHIDQGWREEMLASGKLVLVNPTEFRATA